MEIALYILVGYLILAIISRIFAERSKSKMLTLKAHTIGLTVGDSIIPEKEWDAFEKEAYRGQIIKYTLAYIHPNQPDTETFYDVYEVAAKENRLFHKVEVPLRGEFDIMVHATKPQKVIIGKELSLKSQIDKKMDDLEKKKKN